MLPLEEMVFNLLPIRRPIAACGRFICVLLYCKPVRFLFAPRACGFVAVELSHFALHDEHNILHSFSVSKDGNRASRLQKVAAGMKNRGDDGFDFYASIDGAIVQRIRQFPIIYQWAKGRDPTGS